MPLKSPECLAGAGLNYSDSDSNIKPKSKIKQGFYYSLYTLNSPKTRNHEIPKTLSQQDIRDLSLQTHLNP